MKKLSAFGIIIGAALLCATPFSLRWSPQNSVSLSLDTAAARIGRPLTPVSVAGVHRRAYRRGYDGAGYYGAGYYGAGSYGAGYSGYYGAGYYYGPGYYPGFYARYYTGPYACGGPYVGGGWNGGTYYGGPFMDLNCYGW